jgi:hypothetical protein
MKARPRLPKTTEERLPRRATEIIREVLPHPLKDRRTIGHLGSEPISVERLRRLIGRSTSPKGVTDDLMSSRRHFDTPSGNHGLEFIDMPARLEFLMARRGGIIPEIREV